MKYGYGYGYGVNLQQKKRYEIEAIQFFTIAGITDSGQKRAVNYLVNQLKTNNLYAKFSVLYPFVGGSANSHKYNLINPLDSDAGFRIVWAGSVTHDTNGIKSNGTNGYGNTNYNPFVAGVGLTNLSIGLYRTGTEANGISRAFLGCSQGSSTFIRLGWLLTGSKIAGIIIANNPSLELAPPESSPQFNGLVAINVNGDRKAQLWGNGAKIGTTITQTASAAPDSNLYLLADNTSIPSIYSLETTLKLVYISTGLSDSEMLVLSTIVTAYQTLLGRA